MIAGVIAPGRAYPAQAPLLDLAVQALTDRDAVVEVIAWTPPEGLLEIGPEPFVRAHVESALHRLAKATPNATPVLVAKSLGTHAAALAAERSLPAIWLTPLLHLDSVSEAISRNPAPALLVGGTADPSWLPEAATATGKTVVTIPDADHGLRPPGPLRAYTNALGTVATAIEDFLTTLT
ncbi:alpha/beta hydrolase [Actinoplanes sp. NPDC051861]|uniref:alpha/beta hydrolase n=1 Tax=Actinoplanes sp. NPDC051861 TaxID=3155170 RepID=UPI00341C9778